MELPHFGAKHCTPPRVPLANEIRDPTQLNLDDIESISFLMGNVPLSTIRHALLQNMGDLNETVDFLLNLNQVITTPTI